MPDRRIVALQASYCLLTAHVPHHQGVGGCVGVKKEMATYAYGRVVGPDWYVGLRMQQAVTGEVFCKASCHLSMELRYTGIILTGPPDVG